MKIEGQQTGKVKMHQEIPYCDYCYKTGQTEDRCFKKEREVANPDKAIETALCVYETALVSQAIVDGILNEKISIAGSGISSLMVYSNKYLRDVMPHTATITAGNENYWIVQQKVLIKVISRTAWVNTYQYI